MTFAFGVARAAHRIPSTTLVLVDLCRARLRDGQRPAPATEAILAHCRASLVYARLAAIPVIFVRNRRQGEGWRSPGAGLIWIDGFEPRRHESVFERTGLSCYDSPYFTEIVDGVGGSCVVAGFVGPGGCRATAADAQAAGHRLTFLADAIDDDAAAARPAHLVAARDWLRDPAGALRPR